MVGRQGVEPCWYGVRVRYITALPTARYEKLNLKKSICLGVTGGARTLDPQGHNLVL